VTDAICTKEPFERATLQVGTIPARPLPPAPARIYTRSKSVVEQIEGRRPPPPPVRALEKSNEIISSEVKSRVLPPAPANISSLDQGAESASKKQQILLENDNTPAQPPTIASASGLASLSEDSKVVDSPEMVKMRPLPRAPSSIAHTEQGNIITIFRFFVDTKYLLFAK
jgi:hypothetical protein